MISWGKLIDDGLITPVRDAIARIYVLRVEAVSIALEGKLQKAILGIKFVTQDKPLFQSSMQIPNILDPDATFKANPGVK
jgi:hypothetical protein